MHPLAIGLAMAFVTSFGLYRTPSIYFADPKFFMWTEQGFLARFLIPGALALFVPLEWFLVEVAAHLSSGGSISVRIWRLALALEPSKAPLTW